MDVAKKVRVYGDRSALTVERTMNRQDIPTLSLEFASRDESAETRRFNWNEKLIVQLKPVHLPLYAAAVLADLPTLKLDHYGEERTKSLEVRGQSKSAGALVLVGSDPAGAKAVPVSADRVYWLAAQVISVLLETAPTLDAITVRSLIKRCAQAQIAQQS